MALAQECESKKKETVWGTPKGANEWNSEGKTSKKKVQYLGGKEAPSVHPRFLGGQEKNEKG